MDNKLYATVIIKPDSVRDFLDMQITQDLVDAGIDILWRKRWIIREEQVALIYPQHVDSPIFPSTQKAMSCGPSILMVVEGDDVYTQLKDIKGKMNLGGIRLKYRRFSKEQFVEMGYEGKELLDVLAENRIHTSDNLRESAFICSLATTPYDIEQLANVAPDFASAVVRFTSLQIQ